MKIQKKKFFFFFFWGGGGVRSGGVGIRVGVNQGGCERKIEVFCENSKKSLFWGVGFGGSGWM